jgi:hypothetical protein
MSPAVEHLLPVLVATGLLAFAVCGAVAFPLETFQRVATLRFEARRMQLRAMRDRLRRLSR